MTLSWRWTNDLFVGISASKTALYSKHITMYRYKKVNIHYTYMYNIESCIARRKRLMVQTPALKFQFCPESRGNIITRRSRGLDSWLDPMWSRAPSEVIFNQLGVVYKVLLCWRSTNEINRQKETRKTTKYFKNTFANFSLDGVTSVWWLMGDAPVWTKEQESAIMNDNWYLTLSSVVYTCWVFILLRIKWQTSPL